MPNSILRRSAPAALFALAAAAHAQNGWTFTSLHPKGAAHSAAFSIDGRRVVGTVNLGGTIHAAVWDLDTGDYIDLNPPQATSSSAYKIQGDTILGDAAYPGVTKAGLWTSPSPASFISLHPKGYSNSEGYGLSGNVQTGWAIAGEEISHAGFWTGSADSWVDLHPGGGGISAATCADGDYQYGYTQQEGFPMFASVWHGAADTYQPLQPGQFGSSAILAAASGQQVGWVSGAMGTHAAIWRGTVDSFIDLTPSATEAQAYGTDGTNQVGYMLDPGYQALFWSGTPESVINLHALMPQGYGGFSLAYQVQSTDNEVWVVGNAYNQNLFRQEAVVWHHAGCYADFTGDGSLDLFDFLAFVNFFNAADPKADCDHNGTHDLFDFLCFVNAFNAGC